MLNPMVMLEWNTVKTQEEKKARLKNKQKQTRRPGNEIGDSTSKSDGVGSYHRDKALTSEFVKETLSN